MVKGKVEQIADLVKKASGVDLVGSVTDADLVKEATKVAGIEDSTDIMVSLAGTSRTLGVTSAVSYNLKDGVTGLIATFPKGVKPANEVLDALYDWAEEKGLQEVVEKIIELESEEN